MLEQAWARARPEMQQYTVQRPNQWPANTGQNVNLGFQQPPQLPQQQLGQQQMRDMEYRLPGSEPRPQTMEDAMRQRMQASLPQQQQAMQQRYQEMQNQRPQQQSPGQQMTGGGDTAGSQMNQQWTGGQGRAGEEQATNQMKSTMDAQRQSHEQALQKMGGGQDMPFGQQGGNPFAGAPPFGGGTPTVPKPPGKKAPAKKGPPAKAKASAKSKSKKAPPFKKGK